MSLRHRQRRAQRSQNEGDIPSPPPPPPPPAPSRSGDFTTEIIRRAGTPILRAPRISPRFKYPELSRALSKQRARAQSETTPTLYVGNVSDTSRRNLERGLQPDTRNIHNQLKEDIRRSTHDISRFKTRTYDKFKIDEYYFTRTLNDEKNVYTLLNRIVKRGLEPGTNYFLTLMGEFTTRSKDEDGDEDVRKLYRTHKTGTITNIGVGDSQALRDFVSKYYDEAVDLLMAWQRNSDSTITFDPVFSMKVLVKKMDTNGRTIGMLEEYEDILYNPKSVYTCLVDCFIAAGMRCNLSYAEIYKDAGKRSVEPVASSQINKFLSICDPDKKFSVVIHKFKEDGTLQDKGTTYKGESIAGERITIHMLLHLNHYMLFTNASVLERRKLRPDGFWNIEDDDTTSNDNNTPLELTLPKQVPIPITKKPATLDISHNNWFWDMETRHGETQTRKLSTKHVEADMNGNDTKVHKSMIANEHNVYNIGYCKITDLFEYSHHDKSFEEKPKNIARMKKAVKIHYGDSALKDFMEFLSKLATAMEEKHRSYVVRSRMGKLKPGDDKYPAEYEKQRLATLKYYQATFWSQNGGRFDHFLLLKDNMAKGALSKMLMANGILTMTLWDYIVFKDFYRQNMCSLAALCKSFNLPTEYSKTSFPHDFMNAGPDVLTNSIEPCVDALDYVGPVPDAKYWPGGKVPDENMGKIFNLREVSIDYQKLDVISMGICFKYYCEKMYGITGYNPQDMLTTPSLSYKFMTNETKGFDVRIIKHKRTDDWLRQAILGGRCFVQKRFHKSEIHDYLNKVEENGKTVWDNATQEERKAFIDNCEDGLVDFDGVSLYPSAMALFEYPVGEVKWLSAEACETLRLELNRGLDPDHKISVIECDLKFPNKKVVTPLIPEWNGPRRVYTLHDKKNIVLTSVDIEEAVRYNGAIVTKIHRALEWPRKEYIFRDVIKRLFEERLKAKDEGDDAMATLLKLLMNSGYGMYGQKLIDFIMMICNDNVEMEKVIMAGRLKSFDMIDDDKISLDVKIDITDDSKQFKPVQINIFILAYSKRLMNQAVAAVDGFSNFTNAFYYTDTDSMIIMKKQLDMITKMVSPTLNINGEQQSFVGKQLGQLHDDLGDGVSVITHGQWIAPKLYCLEYLGFFKPKKGESFNPAKHGYQKRVVVRSKGVNLNQHPLSVDDFRRMLNDEKVDLNQRQFKRIKKDRKITIETQQSTKTIGGRWQGRELIGDCWVPFGSEHDNLPVYS